MRAHASIRPSLLSPLAIGLALGCVIGCARGEPPAWDGGLGTSPSVAPLPASAAGLPAAQQGSSSASSVPPPATSGAAPVVDGGADAAKGALPQTRDRPGSDSAAFNARVAALWSAIVADEPERAMPFFFPAAAYDQVKDIPVPSRDWKGRLVAAYARDIHALHKRLGPNAATAKWKSFDVPDDRAKWVDPGHEMNKIGYWRVFGTKLRYEDDGKDRSFDVTSLISWRGEWYVVHLTGVK
jgi:hypothetical protein